MKLDLAFDMASNTEFRSPDFMKSRSCCESTVILNGRKRYDQWRVWEKGLDFKIGAI